MIQTSSAQDFSVFEDEQVIPQDSSLLGNAIYDSIMTAIEPELVSKNVPLLQEKYKNETPEQAQARSERYERAYVEYDKRIKEQHAEWNKQLVAYKKNALKSTEEQARKEEKQSLLALEKGFVKTEDPQEQ